MLVQPRLPAGRRLRGLLLISLLATGGLAAAPGAASAGVPGCSLSAGKPGGAGTTAFGRFTLTCFVAAPFEYQVALWERDEGADQKLSQAGWITATVPSDTFTYKGKGPAVACQTEAGKEELYTRVRVRVGSPGNYETTPWKRSEAVTTRTCQ